jgi:VanZ family protein
MNKTDQPASQLGYRTNWESIGWASRALAWSLAAAILILSVVPPSARPVTGAPHALEHFAIFALCGSAFGFGYRIAGVIEGLALVTFAGAIELMQLIVPGRHARLSDFAIDAIASCVGIFIGWLGRRIIELRNDGRFSA